MPPADNIITMRFRRFLLVLSLALTACGGVTVETADGGAVSVDRFAPAHVRETSPAVTPTTTPHPVWEGFESTIGHVDGLTAVARGPLGVFESPGSGPAWTTLEPTTILGTTTVLAVVDGPRDGWVEVMLPIRPNGSTGWVATDQLSFYVVDGEILVDLSDRHLTYVVDGVELLHTEIGVGSDYNQTPTGHYFVTDRVTVTDPDSPWGPHALGISARSDSITEFNGGDGIIGIHGTNNPASIGHDISLGCIRLPNDVMTALHGMVPIGTRVVISA